MSSRASIWAGMDRLEGKKEGSSHAALNKERVRQGYKKETSAKSHAIKNKKETKKEYTKRHGADLLKYETN